MIIRQVSVLLSGKTGYNSLNTAWLVSTFVSSFVLNLMAELVKGDYGWGCLILVIVFCSIIGS